MKLHKPLCLALSLAALLSAGFSVADDSNTCLDCHDIGPDSAMAPMLDSIHGLAEDGCASCHGPSVAHSERPTTASPDTNFGPRWSSSAGQQDEQCLTCHEEDVAEHWEDALHMANKLTCVTCHDMHAAEDKALDPHTQAEVCTTCHKVQKQGIHALEELVEDNPVCTTCHNPHGDQSPVSRMLANRSEGCRTCHDLVAMQAQSSVSQKAKSYHKVMAKKDRTCLDCHGGVAHGPAGAFEPFIPLANADRTITLFYPGQSDVDWILSEHPGSQPLRQGTNCQQCHRGEEASMGAALGAAKPTSREIDVSFREEGDELSMKISWAGSLNDAAIAVMWGDDGNEAFRRGGCWAACHSDMPGMSRDRGQALDKYLGVSRQQEQRIGQPRLVKESPELDQLMRDGNFVEMWRIKLADGKTAEVSTATLLSELKWASTGKLRADASFADGRWTVALRRPLIGGPGQKSIHPEKRYTFGLAMHSAQRSGSKHWVSLPMTISLNGEDADFLAD